MILGFTVAVGLVVLGVGCACLGAVAAAVYVIRHHVHAASMSAKLGSTENTAKKNTIHSKNYKSEGACIGS